MKGFYKAYRDELLLGVILLGYVVVGTLEFAVK